MFYIGNYYQDRPITVTCKSYHPLILVHPRTNEKCLNISPGNCLEIEGMTNKEFAHIKNKLVKHLTDPKYEFSLKWDPNMIVIWDNRSVLHSATGGYTGYQRKMYRTQVLDC